MASEYLHRQRNSAISDAYNKAYGGGPEDFDKEFSGWSGEGVWPDD